MKKIYFEYPVPYLSELRELYKTPYRFSDELRAYVDYMFTHPYNKYNGIYYNLHQEFDSNDMLKSAYLIARYYMDHPNQFAGSIENCADEMLVKMWKCFIALHKHLRGVQFDSYMTTQMKVLTVGGGKFLDLLIDEIRNEKMIMDGDDMVKRREGKSLRERAPASMKEGGKEFEYLCSLD